MSKGKTLIGLIILAVIAGGIIYYQNLTGPTMPPQDPETLEIALGRNSEVVFPKGTPAPFPVALMFHGCGGTHKATRLWANRLAAQGYAAVIIDSLGARDISHETAMAEVCQGSLLRGDERSADILVMLNWVDKQPWADGSKVLLAGWSHGAWTILDVLARDLDTDLPISLTTRPTSQDGTPVTLDGVTATLLFYPYCGQYSHATRTGLHTKPRSLLMLAGEDSVVSMDECNSFAAAEAAKGWDVSTHIFPDADHSFDVPSYDGQTPNKSYSVQGSLQAVKLFRNFMATAQ